MRNVLLVGILLGMLAMVVANFGVCIDDAFGPCRNGVCNIGSADAGSLGGAAIGGSAVVELTKNVFDLEKLHSPVAFQTTAISTRRINGIDSAGSLGGAAIGGSAVQVPQNYDT